MMTNVKAKPISSSEFLPPFEPVFETWFEPLYPILNTLYFRDLIVKLNYKFKVSTIYPKRSEVFKAFRITEFDNLKVVILGQDPYTNGMATGLAFANPEDTFHPNVSLYKIQKAVERDIYNGFKLDFDFTLESWAEQGVLLLNSSLTVGGVAGSHSEWWEPFTRETIKIINDSKQGIIFMLWGNDAQKYSKFIDENKHTVLTFEHPSYAARRDEIWKCKHFSEANEIIKEYGGEQIEW